MASVGATVLAVSVAAMWCLAACRQLPVDRRRLDDLGLDGVDVIGERLIDEHHNIIDYPSAGGSTDTADDRPISVYDFQQSGSFTNLDYDSFVPKRRHQVRSRDLSRDRSSSSRQSTGYRAPTSGQQQQQQQSRRDDVIVDPALGGQIQSASIDGRRPGGPAGLAQPGLQQQLESFDTAGSHLDGDASAPKSYFLSIFPLPLGGYQTPPPVGGYVIEPPPNTRPLSSVNLAAVSAVVDLEAVSNQQQQQLQQVAVGPNYGQWQQQQQLMAEVTTKAAMSPTTRKRTRKRKPNVKPSVIIVKKIVPLSTTTVR